MNNRYNGPLFSPDDYSDSTVGEEAISGKLDRTRQFFATLLGLDEAAAQDIEVTSESFNRVDEMLSYLQHHAVETLGPNDVEREGLSAYSRLADAAVRRIMLLRQVFDMGIADTRVIRLNGREDADNKHQVINLAFKDLEEFLGGKCPVGFMDGSWADAVRKEALRVAPDQCQSYATVLQVRGVMRDPDYDAEDTPLELFPISDALRNDLRNLHGITTLGQLPQEHAKLKALNKVNKTGADQLMLVRGCLTWHDGDRLRLTSEWLGQSDES